MRSALIFAAIVFMGGIGGARAGNLAVEADAAVQVSEKPTATKENSSYVICRNQKHVRTIRIEKHAGGCRALYTKDGKDDVVGKSNVDEVCFDVVFKIRQNLEKGSWKCKEVSPERVSSFLE